MVVVGLAVLAFEGVHGDPVVPDQGGGHVVLGGERVGGAQRHAGSPGFQRADQVCGLGGHMQTSRQADSGEGFLLLEALAHLGQHRHLP